MRAAQNMEVWLKVVFDLWGDGVKGVEWMRECIAGA
jgi:hypothetical protein